MAIVVIVVEERVEVEKFKARWLTETIFISVKLVPDNKESGDSNRRPQPEVYCMTLVLAPDE